MARWLGFQDASGKERPREGPGSVEDVVSHKPQVQAALQAKAAGIARRADMLLDVLPKTRTGKSQIQLDKGKLDRYVMLVDETHAAAASIEKNLGVLARSINRR